MAANTMVQLPSSAPSSAVGVLYTFTYTANSDLASGYSVVAMQAWVDANGATVGGAGTTVLEAPVPLGESRPIAVGSTGFAVTFDSSEIAGNSPGTARTFELYPVECSARLERRASATTEAVECGNRGTCDRTSGLCDCFQGYAGSACSEPVQST